MQDLNDLFYFVKVVDHGGFAPAGRALGLPKSKLSRRVAELESRLDTRLINRSPRVELSSNLVFRDLIKQHPDCLYPPRFRL
ncbi:LysR family transcriptional regulator, partial [Marinobacter salarius]|uniref:LysR family transcriptional regulator n=1 Tax=Marinobacter salarius TaxID=1420917 RepID=UPI003008E3CF